MLRTIQDLFVAGSETLATTLDWAFLYMIEYPEVQRKCQQEIEEVIIIVNPFVYTWRPIFGNLANYTVCIQEFAFEIMHYNKTETDT